MRVVWRWLFALIFTISFLSLVVLFFIEKDYSYYFGFNEIFLGGLSVFLSYFFRVLRFSMFLRKPGAAVGISSIVMVHGALNYFLPVKTGELSFVYLAKKYYDAPVSSSLSILLVFRFFDLSFVVFSFVCAACFFGFDFYGLNLENRNFFLVAASVFFGLLLVLIAVKKIEFVKKVCVEVRDLILSLKKASAFSFFVLTFFIWINSWGAFYFFALGAGYTMSALEVVSVSLLLVPLAFVPVQGFANVGTYETAWVLVLAGALGTASAVQVAVSTHIQFTICMFAVGCVGFFCLMLDKWRLRHQD